MRLQNIFSLHLERHQIQKYTLNKIDIGIEMEFKNINNYCPPHCAGLSWKWRSGQRPISYQDHWVCVIYLMKSNTKIKISVFLQIISLFLESSSLLFYINVAEYVEGNL